MNFTKKKKNFVEETSKIFFRLHLTDNQLKIKIDDQKFVEIFHKSSKLKHFSVFQPNF